MNWEFPYHLVEREETAEVSRRAEMSESPRLLLSNDEVVRPESQ